MEWSSRDERNVFDVMPHLLLTAGQLRTVELLVGWERKKKRRKTIVRQCRRSPLHLQLAWVVLKAKRMDLTRDAEVPISDNNRLLSWRQFQWVYIFLRPKHNQQQIQQRQFEVRWWKVEKKNLIWLAGWHHVRPTVGVIAYEHRGETNHCWSNSILK